MKRNIKLLALLFAWTAVLSTSAQELRSSYFMETSVFRHQMNPALLENSHFSLLFGNVNVGTTGNLGAKNFVFDLPGNPNYKYTTFMNPIVSADEFLNKLDKHNRVDAYVNYNLLSVGFNAFGGTNLLEANLRSNTNVSLPYELFEFAKSTGAREEYDLSNIGIRTQNYIEFALGHAHDINKKIRVGAKVKFLLGAAYADFSANRLGVTLSQDKWRIQTDAHLKAALLKSKVTHDTGKPSSNGRPVVDGIDDISFGIPGFGAAVDLGVTYKVTKDLTLSAGITDLGVIKWKDAMQASTSGDYTFEGFENIKVGENGTGNDIGDEFEQIGEDLEEMFQVYDDGNADAKGRLAATINVGAQYALPVYDKLRFGLLYTGRLDGMYSWHQAMLSANIRPVKWFEFTANCAYSNTGFTYGGAFSFKTKGFNLYLGADRFVSRLSKDFIPLNHTNSNINLGIAFPLH